ncbi:hypothetical protein MuYL_3821 [Mucilaginibacter xinganensis]|uniref:Uncharacterized protein n=1 Tax=Mucilaginibacter xinganensis TaxID=1234841 RepID=A0A223P0V2_9SPHI|nr:hypothetical protein MuYL_3821 [Mucilaginibacter xinganensis]
MELISGFYSPFPNFISRYCCGYSVKKLLPVIRKELFEFFSRVN